MEEGLSPTRGSWDLNLFPHPGQTRTLGVSSPVVNSLALAPGAHVHGVGKTPSLINGKGTYVEQLLPVSRVEKKRNLERNLLLSILCEEHSQ